MSDRARVQPFDATKHEVALFVAAGGMVLSVMALPRALLSLVGSMLGLTAALVLIHFARSRYRNARKFLAASARPAAGRIRERREGECVQLELPADGLEPWAANACIVAVATGAAWTLSMGTRRAFVFGFLAVLLVAIGARLRAIKNDRIVLELCPDKFKVESSEAGRQSRQFGSGALLPELRPDGLTLWSASGRIGVLRGELLPEERTWLSERLASFAENQRSIAGKANKQVDQEHAGDDGKSEQAEHAK